MQLQEVNQAAVQNASLALLWLVILAQPFNKHLVQQMSTEINKEIVLQDQIQTVQLMILMVFAQLVSQLLN